MFSARGLFSHIPCPYQDDCKIPRCLFLHTSDQADQEQPSLSTPDSAGISKATHEEEMSEQDVPRKRQKLNNSASKDTVELTSSTLDSGASQLAKVQSGRVDQGRETVAISTPKPPAPQSNGKAVSRNNGLPAPKPLSSHAVANQSRPPSSLDKARAVKTAAKPSIDTKKPEDFYASSPKVKEAPAETLYPRMVTPAPAKYDIRLRFLRLLHEHFVRLNVELAKDAASTGLVLSCQTLITTALDMEENAATDKPAIYSNVVKNKILVYKRMTVADWKKERESELEAKIAKKSQESGGSKDTKKQIQPMPKSIESGLPDYQELLLLHRLYADFTNTPQDKHGFILTLPTDKMVETSRKGLQSANNWECCERCQTRFQVFPGRRESDGVLTTNGPCEFHWGKPFWQDLGQAARGRGDRKYRCCGEAVGISAGCVKIEHHVFKVTSPSRLAIILPFLETPENPELEKKLGEKEVLRPVCIDGEMAFTVYGLELIRLTATSWPSGSELLDILVRPIGEITDLNSRFSGVWPQQLADAKPWTEIDPGSSADLRIVSGPVEARNSLLKLLTPKTPIVGHGLENDLNAIRLIHPTIIDTALLFPHRAGLPYRLSLKALMLEHLGRHIQLPAHSEIANEITKTSSENGEVAVANGGAGGHDSKEDANAAGDMARFALAKEWEKMKREGWSWRDPTTSTISRPSFLYPASSSKAAPAAFFQHFIPPPSKIPIKPNLLSVATLEGTERDPTIITPTKKRKAPDYTPVAGEVRKETHHEGANRERAERRKSDEVQRKKLEEEARNAEEIRKGKKRGRDGRVVIGYEDLDGANDREEDDEFEDM